MLMLADQIFEKKSLGMAVNDVSFSWLHRRTGNKQGAHSTSRFPNTETRVQGLPWESAGALCTGITRMWCCQNMVSNRNGTYLIDSPNPFRFSLFSAFWKSSFSLFLVTIENCTRLCGLSVLISTMKKKKVKMCYLLPVSAFQLEDLWLLHQALPRWDLFKTKGR